MTPESVVGLLHLADRFNVMVLHLLRQPVPEPPPLPGRIVKAPEIPDPATDALQQDAELQAAAVWRALASDTEGGTHD